MNKDLINKIQNLKDIQPSKEWVDLTRYELLSEMEKEAAFRPSHFWAWFKRPQMDALVICLLLIFLGGPWLAVKASQASLPGDFLYSLKKASEDVQRTVVTEEGKSQLEVEFAYRRLEELNKLADLSENGKKEAKAKEVVACFKDNLAGAVVYADRITPEDALTLAKKTKRIGEDLDRAKGGLGLSEEVETELSEAEKTINEINYHILTVLARNEEGILKDGQASSTDKEIITYLEEKVGTTTDKILEQEEGGENQEAESKEQSVEEDKVEAEQTEPEQASTDQAETNSQEKPEVK